MCFSASASFTAAAALTVIGVFAQKKVSNKRYILLASIPLFFALQQCAEGIVWVSFNRGITGVLPASAIYTFLFFAFLFWPVWIPLSFMLPEKNVLRRHLLIMSFWIGIALSLYLLAHMITTGAYAYPSNCHIVYQVGIHGSARWLVTVLYFLSVVNPFFISSLKKSSLIGLAITVAYSARYWFYYAALISVWCFFAAIISLSIVYIIDQNK